MGATNPITGTLAFETLAHVKVHGVTVRGRKHTMEFFSTGRRGNYSNDQQRNAWSAQWQSAVSGVRRRLAGTHFFKAGGDVLFASSREHSTYRPILISAPTTRWHAQSSFEPSDGTARSAWDVTVLAQHELAASLVAPRQMPACGWTGRASSARPRYRPESACASVLDLATV